MDTKLQTPTIGEILKDEFIVPFNITAYRLAKDIHVQPSRILEILNGKRRITVETGLKLSKYFGMSEKFFINLQSDIDIRNEKVSHNEIFEEIVPLVKTG